MSEQVRMPLGADSAVSAAAERLQFTLGDGPCVEAYRTGHAGQFSQDDIAGRWPFYARRLFEETPFRSCATVPLDLGDDVVGALDLYLRAPEGMSDSAMLDVEAVASEVTHTLLADTADAGGEQGPSWLRSDSIRARANLWVAIGLFLPSSRLTATHITALIRGYAFEHGKSLDEITEALVDHVLDPRDILDE